MTNIEYVENIKNLPSENKNIILSAMEKYGDNKWWLSEDVKIIGYYQLNEPILIVDFSKFHEGVEKLLGRSVWTHEFALNLNDLRKEAEEIWNTNKKDEFKNVCNMSK